MRFLEHEASDLILGGLELAYSKRQFESSEYEMEALAYLYIVPLAMRS